LSLQFTMLAPQPASVPTLHPVWRRRTMRTSSLGLEWAPPISSPDYHLDSLPRIRTSFSSRRINDAIGFCIQTKIRFLTLVPNYETGRTMTTKQRQAWRELCLKAVQEPDPAKQLEIVAELNRMLQPRPKLAPSPLNASLKPRPTR